MAFTFTAIQNLGLPMSRIDDFKNTTPMFLPERFFSGQVEGWVVVDNLLGKLRNRATILGTGNWDEPAHCLTFSETYTFDDGEKDTFQWRIRKIGEGHYRGTEPRLKGEALGDQAGSAFHWRYTRDTPQTQSSSIVLHFDDWFHAIDERVCIVRARIGRFGLPFARAYVTYRRHLAIDP
jgi:uncharacterized protein DUF3833